IVDEDDQFLASVASNFAREGHNAIEVARAIERLLRRKDIAALPSAQQQRQQIADIFGRSFSWVYTHESLLKLHPDVLAMMHPQVPEKERLSLQIATTLTSLPKPKQIEIANRIRIH